MTAEEFKIKYPHLSHLEGNELWDAMEKALILENGSPIFDINSEDGQKHFKENFCTDKPLGKIFSGFGVLIPMGDNQPPKIKYID